MGGFTDLVYVYASVYCCINVRVIENMLCYTLYYFTINIITCQHYTVVKGLIFIIRLL